MVRLGDAEAEVVEAVVFVPAAEEEVAVVAAAEEEVAVVAAAEEELAVVAVVEEHALVVVAGVEEGDQVDVVVVHLATEVELCVVLECVLQSNPML